MQTNRQTESLESQEIKSSSSGRACLRLYDELNERHVHQNHRYLTGSSEDRPLELDLQHVTLRAAQEESSCSFSGLSAPSMSFQKAFCAQNVSKNKIFGIFLSLTRKSRLQ
jgi:hypothetical protein